MTAWCSAADVSDRLSGNVSEETLLNAASTASSLLHVLSGRTIRPTRTAESTKRIDTYGRISLSEWVPVRRIVKTVIDDRDVEAILSSGRSFATVPVVFAGRVARLSLVVGTGIPNVAREAATALAAELVRADQSYDGEDAREDPRLSSISRQGVTWAYRDVNESIKDSLVGVYEVDLFLRAVNPNGVRHRARVVTP